MILDPKTERFWDSITIRSERCSSQLQSYLTLNLLVKPRRIDEALPSIPWDHRSVLPSITIVCCATLPPVVERCHENYVRDLKPSVVRWPIPTGHKPIFPVVFHGFIIGEMPHRWMLKHVLSLLSLNKTW